MKEREKEIWYLADRLTQTFIHRKDIYARQTPQGGYVCVHRPFTSGLMYQHLMGDFTLGTYLLDQESRAWFTVLDADDNIAGLAAMAASLEAQELPCYLETSRRGGHLWFFFREPVAGQIAHRFGLWCAHEYSLSVEVYPKQEQLATGPGSLIRIPFGIHRKSGQRYGFIHPDGRSLGTLREQAETLCDPLTVPVATLRHYQYQPERKSGYQPHSSLPVDLKTVPLVEIVSQYVDLRPVASGYIGLCPFHYDKVPSFGINTQGNFWHCFAGCGGGDLAHFYAKLKNITYTQAVEELKHGRDTHHS
jgi:hypothetical protein